MNRNALWLMILLIVLVFMPSGLMAKDSKKPNILV